ncbi:hypothetical protein PS15p_208503 [Mucor circinelloides]
MSNIFASSSTREKMKVSVAPLLMHIVTTRGGDKPNHWATIKLRRSIKLKWPTIDKLYRKAEVIFDCLNSNNHSKIRSSFVLDGVTVTVQPTILANGEIVEYSQRALRFASSPAGHEPPPEHEPSAEHEPPPAESIEVQPPWKVSVKHAIKELKAKEK